ncbi:dipeptidyl aminopeptidases/acylaminoacyl-peptidases [Longilinea arvoryzae]|uniref:Dipeptidyl aminopeptidases/acylaminoacyl-peptidases n=1 Tax=Longilinea arvoryzae TaxID=360412 RepID=A0A0S7BCW5_9CHLR|nr:prolyl oligopeptidase family serine peptidase [Longilinea arvoryzae]GAP15550.1 dipeptidyl aminopeptidases/acylaminoacyl-peptidases [Longilinea arvoryzae]
MMAAQKKPFGLWQSPFSAEARAGRIRLQDVRWDRQTGDLVWLERGPAGTQLMILPAGGERRILSAVFEIGGGVGYGGGDFDVQAGTVIFVGEGRQLFRLDTASGDARSITPPLGAVASPALSPDGRWVVFIASDGEMDALYRVDAQGKQAPDRLAWGADFYMDPVWHPAGDRLAWVEWNHPDMPWDGSRVVLAELAGEPPRIVRSSVVAGGSDAPAGQPAFSPDGRWLSCLTNRGEWDQLVLVDLSRGERRELVSGDGVALVPPAWVQGLRSYGWYGDSRRLAYLRNQSGIHSLNIVDLSGNSQAVNLDGYTWAAQLSVCLQEDKIALVASGSAYPARLVGIDSNGLQVLTGGADSIQTDYFAPARPLDWIGMDGGVVHGLYYPPTNPDFTWEGLPPAIIRVHSGPTLQAVAEFNEEAQYFTSRGFGWLEVNYRGSTGYGRSYQRALNGRWGELDVLDTISAGDGLAAANLADGNRLALYGSSAGGYTVLNTLIRYPGRFHAAIDAYGVSNLFKLDEDTHKFERYSNARLIGPRPQADSKYYDWSPEFHADAIRDPLAIFQGDADRVVPKSQSEAIVAALRRNDVPHLYRLYAGEGHRFRKRETRLDFILSMERFLIEQLSLAG